MDVIRVYANLLELDFVTLFNFLTNCVERMFTVRLAKDALPVLHWRNEVVMKLGYIVL